MGKKGKKKPQQDRLMYRFKTKPYAHQVQALKKLMSNGWGGALLMEPRTGKTKVFIDYASMLHVAGKVNRVLVFCPAGVIGVWEEEIPVHCPIPHRITVWDKDGRKANELPKFGKDVLDFVVVNYEAASTVGDWRRTRKRNAPVDKLGRKPVAWFIPVAGPTGRKRWVEVEPDFEKFPTNQGYVNGLPYEATRLRSRRGGKYAFKAKILAWQPQLIGLDESHRIKSPSASKSRTLHSIGPTADYRVIMTGTVVTKAKRIFDVFSQWKFLNPNRFVDMAGQPMNFAEFKDEYSRIIQVEKKDGGSYPKWIRNRNEGKLHKLMHKDAFSVLREDCFDLPALTSQIVRVHLDESADAYDQMAADMVARIKTGEITEASIALTQGLRLRQLTGGIARTSPSAEYPKGRLVIIGSEKLRVLEDRLEDLMEAGEHVIIGASFRPDLQRIEKMCKKHKWKNYLVMGGVKKADRDRYRREFETHPDGAIFIGNPAAAGEGIDLRSAAIMIWYSLPTSWVQYKQYQERNALHPGPRFEEFLIASGADELTYDTLLADGDVGKAMITSPERLLRNDS